MANREEVLITRLDEVFTPAEALSPYGLSDKWRVIPYVTDGISGNMLSCIKGSPEDISYDPHLTGWYRIYLTLYGEGLSAKLTKDDGYFLLYSPGAGAEEFIWRCADMTGQSVHLSMRRCSEITRLMAIRFVPMTEEEAAALQADEARRDTKRIYATDDMHNRYCAPLFGDDIKEWHPLVDQYVGSDVEWIAMEQVRTFITGYLPGGDPDRFLFQRACDKRVQEQFDREKNDRILKEMTAYSKKKGFKTCLSLRMGAWGMVYPYDQYYFEVPFCRENPHLHCLDRNGNDMNAMSYAFPEVQDFMIGELVNMAKMGPDAVSLIATRGLPYVLFEKPVADRFYEKYGEYPYELPVDEPRLNGIHCEIMLEFMRRVRRSLDEAAGKGRVKIHMFVMASPFDNKMIGLNVEAMMAEGLLDAVVVDSCRFREILPPSVFRETGDRWRIDLTKYEDYVWHQKSQAAVREYFQKENYRGPYENYNGEICGPRDAKEWMDQWNGLEKKYGASVYFNLMPRILPNEEFQRRAAELYGLGAERLCLWDSYLRADYPEMWQTIAKKLGHKDELFEMDLTDPYRRSYQLKKLDGKDFTRYHPNWGG